MRSIRSPSGTVNLIDLERILWVDLTSRSISSHMKDTIQSFRDQPPSTGLPEAHLVDISQGGELIARIEGKACPSKQLVSLADFTRK